MGSRRPGQAYGQRTLGTAGEDGTCCEDLWPSLDDYIRDTRITYGENPLMSWKTNGVQVTVRVSGYGSGMDTDTAFQQAGYGSAFGSVPCIPAFRV